MVRIRGELAMGEHDDFDPDVAADGYDDRDAFGAELDDERDDGRLRDRCVLGAACCCPSLDHGPAECFTADMAEAFERSFTDDDLGAGDA